MKKNLLSILILTLLVVNIAMTAIMMFSMTGATKSTTALVAKIAGILDIELADDNLQETIAITDTDSYTVADVMTIPLKANGDGKDHYIFCKVTLYMNKKNKDYNKYGEAEKMKEMEDMIKSEIIEVMDSHTIDEVKADAEGVRTEILVKLQKMYNSDFIYKVSFSDVKYQ